MTRKILKLGDKVYSQSIQNFSQSYFEGFPQREQYLLQEAKGLDFTFFRHEALRDLGTVSNERERLRTFLDTNTFDAVLIDNPLSVLLVPDDDTPVIFDCIDWYEEMYVTEFGSDKAFFLLRYAMKEALERAELIIAQSPVMLSAVRSWGATAEKMLVIPNGYDEEIFFPYTEAKAKKLRAELAAKHKVDINDKIVITYTGKLGEWYKNIVLIAESISDDMVLFIVGDGPIAKILPSKPNVIMCGPVRLEEVPHYTNAADVLVFPVDVDCSPIAISEYLAVGKPIVMGRGRMEWLLQDGQTGSMVDNNEYSWQRGIESAYEARENTRHHNIDLAKDLTWSKLGAKFSDSIKDLLK